MRLGFGSWWIGFWRSCVDRRIRDLERAAAQGDLQAVRQLYLERVRGGAQVPVLWVLRHLDAVAIEARPLAEPEPVPPQPFTQADWEAMVRTGRRELPRVRAARARAGPRRLGVIDRVLDLMAVPSPHEGDVAMVVEDQWVYRVARWAVGPMWEPVTFEGRTTPTCIVRAVDEEQARSVASRQGQLVSWASGLRSTCEVVQIWGDPGIVVEG